MKLKTLILATRGHDLWSLAEINSYDTAEKAGKNLFPLMGRLWSFRLLSVSVLV